MWQWQRIWALGAFRHRWRHKSWCWPPCKSARDHRRNSGGPWLACCLWMEQPVEDETCGNDSIMTSLIALTVVGQLVDHHDPPHCVNCEVCHTHLLVWLCLRAVMQRPSVSKEVLMLFASFILSPFCWVLQRSEPAKSHTESLPEAADNSKSNLFVF